MKLNELKDNEGARKTRIRVGRGLGSGKGKTAGRGYKGQKSRTGVAIKGFEGGQMPIHRRLPKRGFKNPFRKTYAIVNTGDLQRAIEDKRLDAGKTVTAEILVKSGLARHADEGIKLLAKGTLKEKVTIEVAKASKAAEEAVKKAGGQVTIKEAEALKKAEKPAKKAPSKAKAK